MHVCLTGGGERVGVKTLLIVWRRHNSMNMGVHYFGGHFSMGPHRKTPLPNST